MDVYKFNIQHKTRMNEFKNVKSIILLGEFELFHKGHYQLLLKAQELKQKNNKIGILIINKNKHNQIQNITNRIYNLAKLQFDFVILAEFDFQFKNLEGDEFIKYLDQIFNVSHYIVGQDFKFGKNAKFNANDIKNISNSKVDIIEIFKMNDFKVSTTTIKQMHDFGEYNNIRNLIVNPLIFDVEILNQKLFWSDKINQPHSGIYFFKLLIDGFWYHGLIHFSLNKILDYNLVNWEENKLILNQKTKIEILDINRIIINSRYDFISDEDKKKAIDFFSISI